MSIGRRQQTAASLRTRLVRCAPAYRFPGADLRPYALQVQVHRQEQGRFGVWVEHGKFWDAQQRTFIGQDPWQESQQIAQDVFAQA